MFSTSCLHVGKKIIITARTIATTIISVVCASHNMQPFNRHTHNNLPERYKNLYNFYSRCHCYSRQQWQYSPFEPSACECLLCCLVLLPDKNHKANTNMSSNELKVLPFTQHRWYLHHAPCITILVGFARLIAARFSRLVLTALGPSPPSSSKPPHQRFAVLLSWRRDNDVVLTSV